MNEFENLVSAESEVLKDLSKTDHLKVENEQLKRILIIAIGVAVAIAVFYCIDRYLEEKANREQRDQHKPR